MPYHFYSVVVRRFFVEFCVKRILVLSLLLLAFWNLSANAGMLSTFQVGDTGVASGVVIDIAEYGDGGVLLATPKGLVYSADNGLTWLSFDESSGLVSRDMSALFVSGDTIWVATNHDEEILSRTTTISDGLSYSTDAGETWTQVDWNSAGLEYVLGGDRIIYDISGHRDPVSADENWIFFTAFAAGYIGTRDGGQTWRRVFRSQLDSLQFTGSVQPAYSNRFFSCATDSSHGDTLMTWVGTAAGVYQYIFADRRQKSYSKHINRIAVCDTCPNDNFLFLGGDFGVSRGTKSGGPYISRFTDDGLPGPYVSAMIVLGDRLLVGTQDTDGGASTGLAISDNSRTDMDFIPVTSFNNNYSGSDSTISDFAVMDNRLYMAAEQAGLFVSPDNGDNWTHIFVDSSDTSTSNGRNTVHALEAYSDTLLIGTDSGLVTWHLDAAGELLGSHYNVIPDTDSSGARVVRIRTQFFRDSITADVDSSAVWVALRAIEAGGVNSCGRFANDSSVWHMRTRGTITHDIAFRGDSVAFLVGSYGVLYTPTGWDATIPMAVDTIQQRNQYNDVTDDLLDDEVTSIIITGDTTHIGTTTGFAYSLDNDSSYTIVRPLGDEYMAPDASIPHTWLSSLMELAGEWIVAIGTQYVPDTVDDGLARIWASTRPTDFGKSGISLGRWVEDEDNPTGPRVLQWKNVHDDFAWNFGFRNDSVFAATDGGLLVSTGYETGDTLEWDTVDFDDITGEPMMLEGRGAYAVRAIDDNLWVGTGDRTFQLDLSISGAPVSRVHFYKDYVTPADEIYAYPVPFSHTLNDVISFRFELEQDSWLTLEIYDFAMNLVTRVIDDNTFYPAGLYHGSDEAGHNRIFWNGLNDKGDEVAVGIYYIKLELDNGDLRWGKLAIMP